MKIKNLDHIAITVPDIDEATNFFKKAFEGKIVVEGLTKKDSPIKGKEAEIRFGMPTGGAVVARRVIKISNSFNIELFSFEGTDHQRAAHTYDYGLQHIAVYVDDLQEAANDFLNAGGKLYQSNEFVRAVKAGVAPRYGWLYGETPWGTVIEMVTFKEA